MCVFTPFPGLAHHVSESDIALPSRIKDLANTFPLLFFMLLSNSGSLARRLHVINLAQEGKSLSDVASAYRLPLCLRRIAPDACVTPLPWVDWSTSAAHQLANHIPEGNAEAANWLAGVFHAGRNCNEEFALWLARQQSLFGRLPLETSLLTPLILYAWHAARTDGPLASINPTPWSQQFGMPRALSETEAWLSRLHMLTLCGTYPVTDCWFEPGSAGGYDFVPITTFDELIAERIVMRNCLHTYVDRLADGTCRVFAVKQNGRSVATLELNRHGEGVIHVAQLKGPGNVKVPVDIRAAALEWSESQDDRLIAPVRRMSDASATQRIRKLLKPYRDAIGLGENAMATSLPLLREQLRLLRRHLAATARSEMRSPDAEFAGVAALPIDEAAAARIRRDLRARIGENVFDAWFRLLEFESFDGATVRMSVPVRFLQRWISGRYLDALRASCAVAFPDVQWVEVNHWPARAEVEPQPPPALFDALHGAAMPEPRRVDIDRILAIVSARYQISRTDILSMSRQRQVMRARQVSIYLTRVVTGRSLPDIGRRFGNRDSITVLNAIRRIEQLIEGSEQFRTEMEELRRSAERGRQR